MLWSGISGPKYTECECVDIFSTALKPDIIAYITNAIDIRLINTC